MVDEGGVRLAGKPDGTRAPLVPISTLNPVVGDGQRPGGQLRGSCAPSGGEDLEDDDSIARPGDFDCCREGSSRRRSCGSSRRSAAASTPCRDRNRALAVTLLSRHTSAGGGRSSTTPSRSASWVSGWLASRASREALVSDHEAHVPARIVRRSVGAPVALSPKSLMARALGHRNCFQRRGGAYVAQSTKGRRTLMRVHEARH